MLYAICYFITKKVIDREKYAILAIYAICGYAIYGGDTVVDQDTATIRYALRVPEGQFH